MEAKDLRSEIQKVIETVPESILEDVLLYLKEIRNKTKSQVETSLHLKKILSEDRELLKRLAQ